MIEIPLSDAQYASLATRLRTNGIELVGSSGTLTKDGVTARYAHTNGLFTVEIIDRPMFLPLSLIEGKLRVFLEQSAAYDAGKAAS